MIKKYELLPPLEAGLKGVVIVSEGQSRIRAARMLAESLHQSGMTEVGMRFIHGQDSALDPELRFQAQSGADLALLALGSWQDSRALRAWLALPTEGPGVGQYHGMAVGALFGPPASLLRSFNAVHPSLYRRLLSLRQVRALGMPLAA